LLHPVDFDLIELLTLKMHGQTQIKMKLKVSSFPFFVKMADDRVEVDFSAQCLADKIMISGVN
jgi:hypothetical protein